MKALWAVLILIVAGCGPQEAAPAAEPPQATMSELSQQDMADLIAGGLNRPYGAVLVSEELVPGEGEQTKIPFIRNKTHFAELGYLRNPGVRVAVLTKTAAGKRIEGSDRMVVEREAKEAGLKVWPDLKVEQMLGPDGKTPMVLVNGFPYDATAEVGVLVSTLAYETEAAANEAKDYFGPGYTVIVKNEPSPPIVDANTKKERPSALAGHPWKLEVRGRGVQAGANDEMDELDRIATATNGIFVTTYFTK